MGFDLAHYHAVDQLRGEDEFFKLDELNDEVLNKCGLKKWARLHQYEEYQPQFDFFQTQGDADLYAGHGAEHLTALIGSLDANMKQVEEFESIHGLNPEWRDLMTIGVEHSLDSPPRKYNVTTLGYMVPVERPVIFFRCVGTIRGGKDDGYSSRYIDGEFYARREDFEDLLRYIYPALHEQIHRDFIEKFVEGTSLFQSSW